MKSSLVGYFVFLVMSALPQCISFTPKTFSNGISIFPGPTVPVYFGGNLVEDITYAVNEKERNMLSKSRSRRMCEHKICGKKDLFI